MGFGLSGNEMQTQMSGADVTIAWVDGDNAPQAEDYRLSSYSQVSLSLSLTHWGRAETECVCVVWLSSVEVEWVPVLTHWTPRETAQTMSLWYLALKMMALSV